MLNEMKSRIFSGKKSVFIVALLLMLFASSSLLLSQTPQWQWVKKAGGSGTDNGRSISVDGNGNLYVTGQFTGTATFGTTTLTSSGSNDVYVAKLDIDGNWQWAKQAGGIDYDVGYGISVDANGNSYVFGQFKQTATFGTTTLTSSGLYDVFAAKLDTDGNWQWATQAGGVGNDLSGCISVDANGNSFVSGNFQETATFGTTTLTSSGGYDVFAAKLDTDGNWQWAKQAYGINTYDYGYSISVDANSNSYVSGKFDSTATFGATTLTASGLHDVFVAKLDTDGNWQWAKQAGGIDYDAGNGISVDANGNSYVTGKFQGTAYFGVDSLTSSGSDDIFATKLDTDGNWQWAKKAGGIGIDHGYGISVDVDGNSYVTGDFKETATFGTFTLTSSGSPDIFAAKLDTDGNWQWAKKAGGSNYDAGYGISVDVDGNSYVTGYFRLTATFGAFTVTGSGSLPDFFVAKLTEDLLTGDFNYDFYVGPIDLQMIGDHWHFVDTDPDWDAIYDLVQDGVINSADLQVFGDHWHEGTPPPKSGSGNSGKGPNVDAGIVFDLDATTYGNQNLTSIPSQPAGTNIRVDVYCTGVNNLDTYEFEVIYDPTELAYVGASASNMVTFEPNILTTNGGEAIGFMIDSSTPGVLSIAYTLAGTDTLEAPEGEGLIADIVFLSLVDTYGTLSFSDVLFYDSYGVVDLITDTGTATLPVELSTFNAIYNTVSGFVSLYWATASETDVNGFNIYRNTEDSFVEADKINIDLIAGSGTTTETTEYSFTDETADPYYTTYYYWLQVINFGGTNDEFGPYKYIPIDVNHDGELGIITSALNPCYPNPVRIGNEIKFNFRVGGLEGTARNVELKVYNILGKLVAEVVNGERLVNDYTETWTPDNLSNGVYFYQLKTDNYSEVKKMMIQ